MRRWSILVPVVAVLLAVTGGILAPASADITPPTASNVLPAGSVLELTVAGVAGVPADALAVALNMTVTNPAAPGFLTVWPCGSPRPLASNLNYVTDQTVPNLVMSKIGVGGKVCIFSQVTTDVIADVAGYFPAESTFRPTSPERILDTRIGTGAPAGPLAAESTLELVVTGVSGVIPGAEAVVLNVTVTNPAGPGFLTVWPCGAPRPLASNLNYVAGETVPNLVIAKVGAGGKVCIFSQAATDVIADVAGSFPAGTTYHAIPNPQRILDTRSGIGADAKPLAAGAVLELRVSGMAGVPIDALAVAVNTTVTRPAAPGFLTVWPCGSPRPLASNLNFQAGETASNQVISKIGVGGNVCIFSPVATDVIVDVAGFFTTGSSYEPIANPQRILDTRQTNPDVLTTAAWHDIAIGTSVDAAAATGVFASHPPVSDVPGQQCASWEAKPGQTLQGAIVESGRGVVALFFNAGVTTAAGIGIGSSLADLLAAYPSINYTPEEDPRVPVSGRPDAYFSFGIGPGDIVSNFFLGAFLQECFD